MTHTFLNMSYDLQQNKIPSVLAFFPNTRGVGYSYFHANKQHHYSSMITTRNRFTNERYLQRMKETITLFEPKVLVLEEYRKTKGSVKTERIAALIKAISEVAKKQQIEVVFYKRSDIRDVFSFYNVMTKYDIAKLICLWIPALEPMMYRQRSGQRMEPYSSAVFDAVSLAITYFYLSD